MNAVFTDSFIRELEDGNRINRFAFLLTPGFGLSSIFDADAIDEFSLAVFLYRHLKARGEGRGLLRLEV
jgi:hypothetical protein